MTTKLRDGRELEWFPKTDSSPEQFKWADDEMCNKEYDLLKDNAHFIFANKEKVLADSRLFFAPVNIRSGAAYIGAFIKPTLGTYVEWWIARGKDELAVFVSGSPLSGANVSKAIAPNGEIVPLKSDGLFLDLVKQYNDAHKRYLDVRKECDAYTLEEAIAKLKS